VELFSAAEGKIEAGMDLLALVLFRVLLGVRRVD